jgi:2-carboxy-1,4-naphthoquinone phytyltransferase
VSASSTRSHRPACTKCQEGDSPHKNRRGGCGAPKLLYDNNSFICRLSYKGLGEVLCFFAFGPLAVGAAFLAQALPYSVHTTALACLHANLRVLAPAAVVVGLTTSSILFCSHFHQVQGDKQAGKMSPIVRIGTRRGCQVRTSPDVLADSCHAAYLDMHVLSNVLFVSACCALQGLHHLLMAHMWMLR